MARVRLCGVSKAFLVSDEKPALVHRLLGARGGPAPTRVWALRDVDLRIEAGESVGVLGANGSGKTTLLSVMAGITAPTTGTVRAEGRVAPLLTLGSGFHPELTGFDNVFLNGTVLGMTTRQIRQRLDSIAALSGLGPALARPLRTYSAGMQLRLGFAVAMHAEFDVLLMDEVLAVGDLAFQRRCLDQLAAAHRRGQTLVLVSQSPELLASLCGRVLLCEAGRLVGDGPPALIGAMYRQRILSTPRAAGGSMPAEQRTVRERRCSESVRAAAGARTGSGAVEVLGVELLDADGMPCRRFASGDPWTVRVRFAARRSVPQAHVGIAIFREEDFAYVYGPNTRFDGLEFALQGTETGEVRLTIDRLWLAGGTYRVSVAWWSPSPDDDPYAALTPHDYHIARYAFEVEAPDAAGLWRGPRVADAPGTPAASPAAPWAVRTGDPLTIAPVRRHPGTRPARVQIVRDDGLECLQAWCRDSLHWPEFLLLPGRYDVCVDGRRERTLHVASDLRDHGCVYLPHRWSVAFRAAPTDAVQAGGAA